MSVLPSAQRDATASAIIASAEDWRLVEQLRAGDEDAFMQLVNQYQNALARLAMSYVPSRAVADEVVQETWLGVLQGIHRFEGRSSLKTWLCHILTNTAKKRGQREDRYVTFSQLNDDEVEDAPTVNPERFHSANHPDSAHHWVVKPQEWGGDAEERLLSQEVRALIQMAIEALPTNQRQVISLRDVEGWDPEEVCNILQISETNQRVLLHRARARVRLALEKYFAEG